MTGVEGEWASPVGWVRFGEKRWIPAFTNTLAPSGYLLGWLGYFAALTAFQVLGESWSLVVRIVVSAGAMLVMTVVVAAVLVLATPQAEVDFERRVLRVGRRSCDFDAIDTAVLSSADTRNGTRRYMLLALRGGRLRTGVILREWQWVLPGEDRRVVVEVLRQSSVTLPTSKDDPTGRFTRYNFPGSLTKEQAIEVVSDPPAPGEPLPILGGTPVPSRLRRF